MPRLALAAVLARTRLRDWSVACIVTSAATVPLWLEEDFLDAHFPVGSRCHCGRTRRLLGCCRGWARVGRAAEVLGPPGRFGRAELRDPGRGHRLLVADHLSGRLSGCAGGLRLG